MNSVYDMKKSKTRRSNMKKIIGAACAVFAGLLVLLTGCPTDTPVETGESYIDDAVLMNEKAKYHTAVTFSFDENDAGTDVTNRFIQLRPGKAADREVTVSVSSAGGGGYFTLQDGKLTFSGIMPMEADTGKEIIPRDDDDEEIVERSGITNGEIITLSFQKGEASATLEVLGVIKRKGTEEDEERIAVSESDTFVLYGFDVIKSGYISRGDVKTTRPILDVAKVNAADMVRQTKTTSSTWESATGESVAELIQSLNGSVSAEYKGVVFGGKAETEFSINSSSNNTTRFAKGRGFHITRDEFLRNTSPAALSPLLNDYFKTDINTQSAEYILESYGTHLIARCYWGGSAEFNYSYTGSSLTTDQQLKAALSATYKGFTGNASAEAQRQAKELEEHSSFNSSSRGGDNTSFTNADQFTSGYPAWVASVTAKPDLCGIPNFDNDLIPIWTIAKQVNAIKADLIRAEFYRRASARGIALAGYKPMPVFSYITAVDVREQKSADVPSGYTNLVRTDMYNPNLGDVLDANNGAGGAWIRIAYKTVRGNSNHDAIADLRVINTGKSATPPYNMGWYTINLDLNKGAGGPYLWLQYRKVNQNDIAAIDFIGCYAGSGPGSGTILSGYSWVDGRVDLNTGVGGTWLYLTMHKSPFKW
jgi:hypothetical protein